MGGGISNISCVSLNVLHPCDERQRGYILGDYFSQELTADNSYGNYHVKNNKYYLSKCVIVRKNLIYLIDGTSTITITHSDLAINSIKYSSDTFNKTVKLSDTFGKKINVSNDAFNKMLNDPEYIEFYKKLIEIILDRDLKRDTHRFYCGSCIKAKADIKLSCGHLTYCKKCIPLDNVICYVCLKTHESPKQHPIIDLSVFD